MSKSVVENSNFVYSESEIKVTLTEGHNLASVDDIYDLFIEAVKTSVGKYIGLKLKDPNIRILDVKLTDFPVMLFSITDTKQHNIFIKFGYSITEEEYQFIYECTPKMPNLIVLIGLQDSICKSYIVRNGEMYPSGDDILKHNLYRAFQKGILGGYVVNGGINCDIANKLVMGCPEYFELLVSNAKCKGLYEMKNGFIEPFYLNIDQVKQGINGEHPPYYLTVERVKEIIVNYDELVSEPFSYKIDLNQYVTINNIRGDVLYSDIIIHRGSLGAVIISLLDSESDITSATRHRISRLPDNIAESVSIHKGYPQGFKHPNWIGSIYRSEGTELLRASVLSHIGTAELACATEVKINLDKAFK